MFGRDLGLVLCSAVLIAGCATKDFTGTYHGLSLIRCSAGTGIGYISESEAAILDVRGGSFTITPGHEGVPIRGEVSADGTLRISSGPIGRITNNSVFNGAIPGDMRSARPCRRGFDLRR